VGDGGQWFGDVLPKRTVGSCATFKLREAGIENRVYVYGRHELDGGDPACITWWFAYQDYNQIARKKVQKRSAWGSLVSGVGG